MININISSIILVKHQYWYRSRALRDPCFFGADDLNFEQFIISHVLQQYQFISRLVTDHRSSVTYY